MVIFLTVYCPVATKPEVTKVHHHLTCLHCSINTNCVRTSFIVIFSAFSPLTLSRLLSSPFVLSPIDCSIIVHHVTNPFLHCHSPCPVLFRHRLLCRDFFHRHVHVSYCSISDNLATTSFTIGLSPLYNSPQGSRPMSL